MFQFSGYPPTVLCIYTAVTTYEHSCVSTFGNLRVNRIFAPNRSLSQLITSFIGSWCQGIHHAPFVAWPICFIFYETKFKYTKNISWLVVFIQTIYYVQFSKNMLCASKSMIWLTHLYSSALLSEFPFERYLVSQNWTDKLLPFFY